MKKAKIFKFKPWPEKYPNGFEAMEFTGDNFHEIQAWAPEVELELVQYHDYNWAHVGGLRRYIQIKWLPDEKTRTGDRCYVADVGDYVIKAEGMPTVCMHRWDARKYKLIE